MEAASLCYVMTPRRFFPKLAASAWAKRPAKLERLALFLVRKSPRVDGTQTILPVILLVPAGRIVRSYSF